MFSFSKNNAILGLDIGFETLKLVELSSQGNEPTLRGAINFALPERILEKDHFRNKEAAATIIKEACAKAAPLAIKAKKIASALPETFVFAKTIQMPKLTEAEYASAVPNEAAQYLPLPISDVYIDYQTLIVHPDESLVDLLFVATPKKLVDEFVEVANMAGFELVALEPKALAVGRALIHDKANESQIGLLIVEIGTEITRLSIWDAGRIRLTTTVGLGKNQISAPAGDPAKGAVLSHQVFAPILDEIAQMIRYHQNRDFQPKKVEKILLCGSGAKIETIDQFFTAETGIQAEIVKPKLAGKDQLETEFVTAYGLALRREDE